MASNKCKHKKEEGIYTTHERENLLFVRAMVDGVLSAAYVKDGRLIAHEPWESVNRQMYNGPCMVFNTGSNPVLDQPKVC